jgi:hypothetical protein
MGIRWGEQQLPALSEVTALVNPVARGNILYDGDCVGRKAVCFCLFQGPSTIDKKTSQIGRGAESDLM